MYDLSISFLLFIIYSFLGWFMEIWVVLFCTKKLVNRGFLIGPICPIYGVSCLLMLSLLQKYMDDLIVLFVMSAIICTIMEYFTSYIMEKMFKARWWDYSDKLFNINGRVCLENAVAFAVLGSLMMYFVNPFFSNILHMLPNSIICIIALIIFIILIVDISISFKIISGFKKVTKSINKDNTEEITKKVRQILFNKGYLYRRLVKAFNFEASASVLKNSISRVTNTVRKAKDNLKLEKEKSKEMAKKIKEEYEQKEEKLKKQIENNRLEKKEKINKLK